MRYFWTIALAVGASFWSLAVPCLAEEGKERVFDLTLYPAAEPRPAMKYRLTVPIDERRCGNAAVIYNKILAERVGIFGDRELWDKLDDLREAPLADLRGKEAAATLRRVEGVIRDLNAAARYETCDWQLPIYYEPFWTIPLREIQGSRQYARCLAIVLRNQIAQEQYDEAVRSLRSGYTFAKNVAHGPCIIQCLIGAAIAGIMGEQAQTFVQQPDAPNLYWALRSLSRPVVDFRTGFEGEIDAIYLPYSFPELKDLDSRKYSPERWQALLETTVERYEQMRQSMNDSRKDSPRKVTVQSALAEGYPLGKQYLMERGRTAAEVEAMPAAQVVLLYVVGTYREIHDELFNWCQVPYADGHRGLEAAEKKLTELGASGREVIPLASETLHWVRIGRTAETRIDRDFAALQVLEALRMYAASHDGQLPEGLSNVTDVPVPTDPFTGQPFVYHRDGHKATLDSVGPSAAYTLRYRIEMRTTEKKGAKQK